MPSSTSPVGGLTLPVPVPGVNQAFMDPAVTGIARYLGWSLRNDLNAKLGSMSNVGDDACPEANVYAWDPQTHFVRRSFPALYLWWTGESKTERETILYMKRTRTLSVAYFYEEVVAPGGVAARSGVLAAVDASLAKASDRGQHPDYAPVGYAAGTSIRAALGLRDWAYEGGQKVSFEAETPPQSPQLGGSPEGYVSRGYPTLLGRLRVVERIEGDTLVDPTDLNTDHTVDIRTNDEGDAAGPVTVLERYLESPDGSEGED